LRSNIRLICLAGAVASVLGLATGARSQDVTVLTVHPSGIDPRNAEALTAEERLERRLKRSNELLRAICVGCGARDALPGAAPFSPMQALRPPERTPSQMLIPHQLPDEVIVETRQVPVPAPELGQAATPEQPRTPQP
jgi:hypothetical protein